MGAAPSRETHRRGLFTVTQVLPSGASSKRQDIVLIPLTKDYFPSPDCPLFVQFHKARCDAAVNYYFRRPGDPGDLSTIPNYAGSARVMPEERMRRLRRRKEVAAMRKKRAEAQEATATARHQPQPVPSLPANGDAAEEESGLEEMEVSDGGNDATAVNGGDGERGRDTERTHDGGEGAGDDDAEEEAAEAEAEDQHVEDDSYPSREALYRGVIDHVEEVLFDTDEEMREAYAYACAHPDATVGPGGHKLRKVLPILCAVAFRADAGKVLSSATAPDPNGSGGAAPYTSPRGAPHPEPPTIAPSHQQILLDTGVLFRGHLLNIVGCFGFVSMQEEVDAILRLQRQRQGVGALDASVLPGGMLGRGMEMEAAAASAVLPTPSCCSPEDLYHLDRYSFGESQTSHRDGHTGAASAAASAAGGMPNAFTPALGGADASAVNATPVAVAHGASPLRPSPSMDMMTLPHPVAAPLAALVFLTKSAGEQNLGRVTHIAATTYYYQLIQAGVIQRRGVAVGGEIPPPQHYSQLPCPNQHPFPLYPSAAVSPTFGPGSPSAPYGGGNWDYGGRGGCNSATYPHTSPLTSMPELFQPPMETFSFSSLLTNIPILSFLYEMKCRWGYLGVLKGGTPTANNSFGSCSMPSFPSLGTLEGRRPGTMMGNHSTGGLAAVDPYSGQDVTGEMEMWITPDEMIHGRISGDLASRLCLSLAERPEVMQERVQQLPSEEDGYWRYRGLVGLSRPPPVPGPGRIVSINPKDVYVVGSDVLPGFDEGDILRFDHRNMVWFADHSIPLEGVVLAAMRPYCKAAREADPTDPNWVTRLAPQEEVDYLREVKGEEEFPAPAATPEQQRIMAAEPDLRVVHEHEGAFYIYKFERDGARYYHGTVPNFANPNKRRGAGPTNTATTPSAAAQHSQAIPSVDAGGPGGGDHPAPAKPGTAAAEKPTVQVPKTIASALFSLFPASRKDPSAEGEVGTAGGVAATGAGHRPGPDGPQAADMGNEGKRPPQQRSASAFTGTAPPAAGTRAPGGGGDGPSQGEAEIPAYLRGRVTSTAIEAARKLVMNLYSYAYGAPTRSTPNAAVSSLHAGSSGPHTQGSTRGGGGGAAQRMSYPMTSPLRSQVPASNVVGGFPQGATPSVAAPPTVAALSASGYGGNWGGTGQSSGGGMYPRNYRALSSVARSSANSTPVIRQVNPPHSNNQSLTAFPSRSPTSSGIYQSLQGPPPQLRRPHWPLSPTAKAAEPYTGLFPTPNVYPSSEAQPSALSSGGHPPPQQLRPSVHVRVSSRSSTHQPVEDGGGGLSNHYTTPTTNGGSSVPPTAAAAYADPASGAGVHQPQQGLPQVKRYTEGGSYVWDWRISANGSTDSALPEYPQ